MSLLKLGHGLVIRPLSLCWLIIYSCPNPDDGLANLSSIGHYRGIFTDISKQYHGMYAHSWVLVWWSVITHPWHTLNYSLAKLQLSFGQIVVECFGMDEYLHPVVLCDCNYNPIY